MLYRLFFTRARTMACARVHVLQTWICEQDSGRDIPEDVLKEQSSTIQAEDEVHATQITVPLAKVCVHCLRARA